MAWWESLLAVKTEIVLGGRVLGNRDKSIKYTLILISF